MPRSGKHKVRRVHRPGGWYVVEGNRVIGRFHLKENAMRRARKYPDSLVVSAKSWESSR